MVAYNNCEESTPHRPCSGVCGFLSQDFSQFTDFTVLYVLEQLPKTEFWIVYLWPLARLAMKSPVKP